MFTFEEQRAVRLLRVIYDAYMNGTHLFRYVHSKNGDAPQQKFIPDSMVRGSKEHLMFLFFANLLTYHSSSDMGFSQVRRVYELAPEAFSEQGITRSENFIRSLLDEVGFIYPTEGARRWQLSGGDLFRRYGGDPTAIFQGQNIRGVVALMNEVERREKRKLLVGFGPKLLSLLALFYEEVGAIEYVEGAFPVDLHVQAECLGLGLVKPSIQMVNATLLAEYLRERIATICRNEQMAALDLSHAMWFLGSRVCSLVCKRKPAQAEVLCPVYQECAGRVSTKAYAKKGKWDLEKKSLPLFDHFNL